MKAILISIKPKYVADILNHKKTIEVRKSIPKCDLPIDVYIYCTKDKELLHKNCADIYWVEDTNFKAKNKKLGLETQPFLNGKVDAKFTLNRIDRHHVLPSERILPFNWNVEEKLDQLCLTKEEVMAYGNGEDYYACLWHIDNLEIFNKPKELSDFYRFGVNEWAKKHAGTEIGYLEFWNGIDDFRLTKGPQSWFYVEDLL